MGEQAESRLVYTDTQVQRFLDYIDLPSQFRNVTPDPSLLYQLHVHTIARVPYENLSLHYNAAHAIDLNPHSLFDKIVTGANGRGGYCMEVGLVYHHVLKNLGFEVYTAPAKNRNRIDGVPTGDWRSWVHIINVVIFRHPSSAHVSKYASDVAFGGDGPTMPMPLDATLIHANLGAQEVRLAHEWLPEQTWRPTGEDGDRQKYWIYQYRNSPDQPWNSFCCFPEVEFTLTDWVRVNEFTSQLGFYHAENVVVVKFLGRRQPTTGAMEIYGKRMLVAGILKENLGGKTRIVLECRTEEERVEALCKYLDIELGHLDASGIKGWQTELPNLIPDYSSGSKAC